MIKNKLLTLHGLIFASLLATPSFADVSLVDAITDTSTVDGTSYTIDGSALDFTGASKLVITIGSEGTSANGAQPELISSLTFGGVALSEAVANDADPDSRRSNVWYVDLAGTTLVGTDIELDFAAGGETSRGYGLSAFTLAGTASGVSTTGISHSNDTLLTPPTAGEFIIGSFSRNNTGIVSNDPGLTVHSNDILEGQYSASSFYGILGAAGVEQTVSVGDMNGSGATKIASFAAVPEPSAALLSALGGLMMLLRRRR